MLIIYLFVTVSAQIACIIHLIKYDRWMRWLMPLIFFPLSPIAYFAVEIAPDLWSHWRGEREKRAKAVATDPDGDLDEAKRALDLVDSIANHVRLADAYMAVGRHAEALPHYRLASSGTVDFRTGEKIARCLFLTDNTEEALNMLDGLASPISKSDQDRLDLLRARVLEDLGRNQAALAIYADLIERSSGDETLCRYAGLLLKLGHPDRARLALEEVEHRMNRIPPKHRAGDAAMYDWAMRELEAIRSDQSGTWSLAASASPAR